MRAYQQRRLRSRDFRRRHSERQARFGGTSDLPGLHAACEPRVFGSSDGKRRAASSTPEELAAAILNCIEAGARIVNLSLAVTRSSSKGERALKLALDHAARLGVVIVAAAGNQGTVGGTVITESSLGHRCGRMPPQRQTPQWVQSRVFHWAAWSARPRRRRYQPRGGRPVADAWRNERRCAVRDRRCRPGVVPATGGERSENSLGVPTSALSRTSLRDAPAVGCMGAYQHATGR